MFDQNLKRGDLAEPYPKLKKVDLKLSPEASELWKSSVPLESLNIKEFKEILKHFKLPVREFKLEDFVRFEVRVDSEKRDTLIFPVRYPGEQGTPIVDLRCVTMCPETGNVIEENFSSAASSDNSRLFPFPHGLDLATKSQSKSVVLVTSVLDSVAILSRAKGEAVVALAEGASFLPPDHLPFFERFQKISLW